MSPPVYLAPLWDTQGQIILFLPFLVTSSVDCHVNIVSVYPIKEVVNYEGFMKDFGLK